MKYLLFILSITLISCQNQQASQASEASTSMADKEDRDPFIHTVFFYLSDELHDEDLADFELGLESLAKIGSISNLRIGKPAMTPREVVDNDYDYALIVEFADMAAHDIYQDHEIHLAFIDEHQTKWEKVQVYDSIMKD